MNIQKVLVAAFIITGLACSVPAAVAKKHHKSHSMSTKQSSMKNSANPSSEGNVGPGTNNNAGKQPGGR
jgi:hypothetical protein